MSPELNTAISIIGLLTGSLSLLGVAYTLGFRLARIETRLDLLWAVDVEDALRSQRDRGHIRRSDNPGWDTDENLRAWALKRTQEQYPEILPLFEKVIALKTLPSTNLELTDLLVKTIGMAQLSRHADILKAPMTEYLALCLIGIRREHRARQVKS